MLSSFLPDTTRGHSLPLPTTKNYHTPSLALIPNQNDTPRSGINSDLEDPVIDALFGINAGWAEDTGMEESIFGVAIAAAICNFGAKEPDPRLKLIGVLAWMCALLALAAQMYLVFQIKVYVSSPTVAEVRGLYKEWANETRVNDVFNVDRFIYLAQNHQELLVKVCHFPISHGPFILIIMMVWLATNISALKSDLLRSLQILLVRTSEDCVNIEPLPAREGEIPKIRLDAASFVFKTCLTLTIFLPKIVIQGFLCLIGCRWLIATTDFGDVLLNACALAFVTELDEIMYKVLLTDYMKNLDKIVVIKAIGTSAEGELRKGAFLFFFLVVGIPATAFLYIRKFQTVIPDYRFDVSQNCEMEGVKELWNKGGSFWTW